MACEHGTMMSLKLLAETAGRTFLKLCIGDEQRLGLAM